MSFNKNQFFLLLFALLLLLFTGNKIWWLANSRKATGMIWFTGHGNLGSVLGVSTYPVIRFNAGKEIISFNGNIPVDTKPGEKIAVRYQINDPSDAKVNTLICIWGDTAAYLTGPLLVLLACFFIPDIFPAKSRIRFAKNPLISFIYT
ncbi:MAG TPA: hypothetical protein VM012_01655 [Flavitalea sp.]|nr:hypothetical protein [Flavitalea sp.]